MDYPNVINLPLVLVILQMHYCDGLSYNDTLKYILFNDNGNSISCKSGQRIDLISYKYKLFDGTSIIEEKNFSDTEELELYQMCSMKETCTNLRFSSNTGRLKNITYIVAVEYNCIDPGENNIFDMCANNTRRFRDTQHLKSIAPALIPNRACRCHIQGNFSVTLSDLRLGVKELNACSSASLRINTEKFQCLENQVNFGSIFKRKTLSDVENAYVSLILNSKTRIPDMVWLKIEPSAISKIRCKSSIKQVRPTRITTTISTLVDNDSTGNKFTNTVIMIICVCTTCALCANIIGVVTICKRRKRIKSWRNTESVHHTESIEETQAINPVSDEEIVPCRHHEQGACDFNTRAANSESASLTVSQAGQVNDELTDIYYEMSVKLASPTETVLPSYAKRQHHNQDACGFHTQARGSRRTIVTQPTTESNALPEENNYLSPIHAVYEKIRPELKYNDAKYSQLDQRPI